MITFPALKSSELSKDFVRDRSEFEITMKGRKRRLDHLSWEEKLQRKKLKNRVAAQTSRDRKKVKMDEMEITIQELMERNEVLLSECQSLRDMNKKLSADNVDLRKQFSGACSQCGCGQNRPVDCNISHGSAESTFPPPQGQIMQSAAALNHRRQTTLAVLKIVLTFLLCQTSSLTSTQNLTLTSLKNSLKVYSKISPQTWKLLLHKNRLQRVICNKITQEKWWGRHQNNWNPVEGKA